MSNDRMLFWLYISLHDVSAYSALWVNFQVQTSTASSRLKKGYTRKSVDNCDFYMYINKNSRHMLNFDLNLFYFHLNMQGSLDRLSSHFFFGYSVYGIRIFILHPMIWLLNCVKLVPRIQPNANSCFFHRIIQ